MQWADTHLNTLSWKIIFAPTGGTYKCCILVVDIQASLNYSSFFPLAAISHYCSFFLSLRLWSYGNHSYQPNVNAHSLSRSHLRVAPESPTSPAPTLQLRVVESGIIFPLSVVIHTCTCSAYVEKGDKAKMFTSKFTQLIAASAAETAELAASQLTDVPPFHLKFVVIRIPILSIFQLHCYGATVHFYY